MGAGLSTAIFAVAISACSSPTEAPSLDTDWTLVAVDGMPLPALIGPGAEIVWGSLELSRDGSYTRQTRAIIEGVAFEDLHTGHWTARVGQIELRPSDGGDPVVARWHDGSIEFPGVRTITYVPSFAAPPAQRNGPAASPSAPGSGPGNKPPRFDLFVATWSVSAKASTYNCTRRSVCALIATMIVLNDISTAPMAGLSTTPSFSSTPAANGMATMLYPAAHQRF